MKLKSILLFVAILSLFGDTIAQTTAGFSANNLFSIRQQSKNDNLLDAILQNTKLNSGAAVQQSFSDTANNSANKKNCGDALAPLSTQAAPCNGVSVTSINFNNTGRITVSGTDNTKGVVYRYPNVGVAPDGVSIDAIVTVEDYVNNQDSTPNDFTSADLPGSVFGYEQNLQPSIGQANNFIAATPWNGSIRYKIQFVAAGTNTPKIISVAATTIDNDGSSACGGLKESVTYSTALNQVLVSASTNQILSGTTLSAGSTANQAGIGISPDYAGAALFVNVSEFQWTYSFATSGNCTVGGATEGRYGSLNLACQINFGRNFASTTVSGNVYNDTDGLKDNSISTVGGTAAAKTNAGGLFANLVDSNGYVVSSAAVGASGTAGIYSFPVVVPGTYKVQISKTQGIESSLAPATILPDGWANTGEKFGTGTGTDGTVDGSIENIVVGTAAITDVNFGIEQPPVPVSRSLTSQVNPGGTISVIVPGTNFSAADPSTGGTVASLKITAFPTNATSLTVDTTTYYPNAAALPTAGNCPTTTCSVFPAAGVPVTSNASGNAAQTIKVDPVSGNVTVGIPYVALDNAGLPSTTPGTVSVPFTAFTVSGNIYNDTDGLTDSSVSTVGGTAAAKTNTGNTLYANLVQGGAVVQSIQIPAGGTYTFAGVDPGSYTVVISSGAPSTTSSLPGGWVNTGEFLGTGAGNDGTVNGLGDGSLAVFVTNVNRTDANFGIEQAPTAISKTAASQTNPGGTNSADVPAASFSGTDATAITNLRLTLFPTNATSFGVGTTTYYPNAAAVPAAGSCPTASCLAFPATGGLPIAAGANGNPTTAVKVDPVDGAVTVVFNYVTVDAAGVESAAAAASVPFATVSLGGKVFNDYDGATNGIANQSGTNAGTTLYANLLDSANKVVQSVLVPTTGIYSFTGLNSGSYTVQLSTNQGTVGNAAPVKALPGGWVNTGENLGTGTGNDSTADGLLAVVVGATNVTDSNFGIEQIPAANDRTETIQNNPGGTTSVTVTTAFTGSDSAPGTVKNIRLTLFPTNATSFGVGTTTYYPNAAAVPAAGNCPTASCLAFPATGGLPIAAGANGNPTTAVKVDPVDGAVTVAIRFVTIDDAGMASSPDASAATVNIPFNLAPTAANGEISGRLSFNGQPIKNALVVLFETDTDAKIFTRTNAEGDYAFNEKTVGKTYVVQPLSNKYSFNSATRLINLIDNAPETNFQSSAKIYRPKNDFDGDGKSDVAVFRPSEGNWYIFRSSDDQMSVFNFGQPGDQPVSGDFDGDGRTDYAVFRPSEGNWYIWQSKTRNLRVEQFGLAGDKLVPADYDGDGKTDIAVYRDGNWYIRQSSDGAFRAIQFGLAADVPVIEDFDGDGQADLSVYRPSEKSWYMLRSSNGNFASAIFGLETDVPVAGDFDGDGFADIAQFRVGNWYILNSTTGFESKRFGFARDKAITGDFDGDGRTDQAIYRKNSLSIFNSGDGTVKQIEFGLTANDILVK